METGKTFKLKLGGGLQLPLAFFTNLVNIETCFAVTYAAKV